MIKSLLIIILGLVATGFMFTFVLAAPEGPSSVTVLANETGGTSSAYELNISGGYIATLNITADTINTRWKAFVGEVTGTFSLEDASGSAIYDWSLASVSGEIYATRNSSSISWTNIDCSNATTLELENTRMNHTGFSDNITATFNNGQSGTHDAFFVGTSSIGSDSCPTLNTYVNGASQDLSFEEIALYESTGSNLIYATIMEEGATGFDGGTYDFQMIVPENGAATFTGATPYYLYVELT